MSTSIIDAKALHSEAAAYAWVEARLWPTGPTCPHCGAVDRISKMGGKSTRIGTYKCYQCRKPFTVKVGTVFEASHVPMHYWLQAAYLMCSSKKGISSNSSTGLWASLSRPHGSCRIAFARLCASSVLNLWAALARSWKSMRPSPAASKECRFNLPLAALVPTRTPSCRWSLAAAPCAVFMWKELPAVNCSRLSAPIFPRKLSSSAMIGRVTARSGRNIGCTKPSITASANTCGNRPHQHH